MGSISSQSEFIVSTSNAIFSVAFEDGMCTVSQPTILHGSNSIFTKCNMNDRQCYIAQKFGGENFKEWGPHKILIRKTWMN